MTRVLESWRSLNGEQRLAGAAATALLVTMFLPWYGLQSLNSKTGQIYSHAINAFGDVSFVEAAIFLVAAGVLLMLFARGEGRDFRLPGGDGTAVMAAGLWAALLIFYRVFSRPSGHGYPVGIEWGFFLAFMAAGGLAYAGWRMRAAARPEPPLMRPRRRGGSHRAAETVAGQGRTRRPQGPPGPTEPVPARPRAAYPPAPQEQLSFEDPPSHGE